MSEFIINQKRLTQIGSEAAQIYLNITQKTLIERLIGQLQESTPFSPEQLRQICKIGILKYCQANEIPIQKIGLLEEEEKREALQKLHKYLYREFTEILADSPTKFLHVIHRNIADVLHIRD
jgi:AraC-like DNA-binding protein